MNRISHNYIKLELCAFALKGEHNVYSLVPNIAVCMYIYIDTKFSYDNNVYFSIFCEHRQLKHGIHVIDGGGGGGCYGIWDLGFEGLKI